MSPIIRHNLTDIRDHTWAILEDLLGIITLLLEQLLSGRARLRARYGQHLGWIVESHDHTVVSRPIADAVAHDPEDQDCICGPDVEWCDPDTGESYDRTFIRHHALDGRE